MRKFVVEEKHNRGDRAMWRQIGGFVARNMSEAKEYFMRVFHNQFRRFRLAK